MREIQVSSWSHQKAIFWRNLLSAANEIMERLHGLFGASICIVSVDLEDVDVVCIKPPK